MAGEIDWYNLGHMSGMALPIGAGTLLGSAFTIMLCFFILSFPLRLLIVYSKNYQIAMRCRMLADWMLVGIIVIVIFNGLSASTWYSETISPNKDTFWFAVRNTYAALMTVVPFYYIMLRLTNRVEFYSDKHVKYLQYFILYLRRFKDDKRYKKSEKKLMHALKRLYFPFAIGKPDEFMPQRGAKRIYVGKNWQDIVIELQQKAPLILQRVNMSESYLWEFEQSVKGGHLKKVLFWVADYAEYEEFRRFADEKYHLQLPLLNAMDCEQVFYLMPDGEFRVYALDSSDAYHDLAEIYAKEHPDHLAEYGQYLYGRRNIDLLRLACSPVYDKRIMPGVNGWSWAGFFFPDFYIICHTIKYRFLIYLLFISLPLLANVGGITNFQTSLITLAFMFAMGANGRTLSWASYKWESLAYFEKWYRSKNVLVVVLGVSRILLFIAVGFWLLFNPFGWDLPHYDWALW